MEPLLLLKHSFQDKKYKLKTTPENMQPCQLFFIHFLTPCFLFRLSIAKVELR